jgi:hypothetical protein
MAAFSVARSMTALRDIIEAARAETSSSLGAFTVLSVPVDPYRLDTPANHIVGKWFAEQMARLRLLHRQLHLRGIHYALLGSTAMPTGEPYTNTLERFLIRRNRFGIHNVRLL